MAFPSVDSRNTSSQGSNSTSHTVNLPSGITSGKLLIVKFGYAVTSNSVDLTGTGFTAITNGAVENTGGSTEGIFTAYRWTDGSEGSTISIATGTATRSNHQSLLISGAQNPSTQAPEAQTSTVNNLPPDPPSLTPTGGAKDYLWIACGSQARSDVDHDLTGAPSSYSNLNASATTGGTGAGWSTGATAERQLNASSENPGAFTSTNGIIGESAAVTIAIHPTTGGTTIVSPIASSTAAVTAPVIAITITSPVAASTASVVSPVYKATIVSPVATATSSVSIPTPALVFTGLSTFPQFALSVTDDFNRANQNPITSPWDVTPYLPDGDAKLSSNRYSSQNQGPAGSTVGIADYGAIQYCDIEMIMEVPTWASSVSQISFGVSNLYYCTWGYVFYNRATLTSDGAYRAFFNISFQSGDLIGFRRRGIFTEIWQKPTAGSWTFIGNFDQASPTTTGLPNINIYVDEDVEQTIDNFRFAPVQIHSGANASVTAPTISIQAGGQTPPFINVTAKL